MTNPRHNKHEVIFIGQHLRLVRTGHADNDSARLLKTPVDEAAGPSALAQLDHEYEVCRDQDLAGVLRPLAKETVDGRPALLFDDPGGVTLAQLLATGPLDIPLFLDVAIALADIIGRLHRKGIVHKDIHSGNIVVCTDGDPVRVYLTGLGIASLVSGQRVEKTAPHKLEGTLAVMSPEQTGRMKRPVDFRTDFYSLGAELYQMLTGRLPFVSDDPLALVHAHLAIAPQAPSKIDPQIPSMLSDLVLKLLAKDADDRYRSAAGIAVDLKRCRGDWHRTGTISSFELARQDVSENFHIQDKLYGREEEIRTLQAAFERTRNGLVELALVTGYAGIGKTELVNQIRKSVVLKEGYFIVGKCDPLNRKIPCAPFVEAISDAVDQILVRPQEGIDRARKILTQILGDQGRVLTEVIPMLSLIVGEQPPVAELPPDQARNRLHLMLQRLFTIAVVRGFPLIVFLDDLQWADYSTLKMLETLACDTDLRNVLLIGAYRDQEVDESHALTQTLEEIDAAGVPIQPLALGPMKAEAVSALIADALDRSPADTADVAALCQEKTGGNPFFLKRFLLELVARRLIFFDATRNAWQWQADKIASADVTDNVVELMADTIAGLEDHVQQALKTAACIGSNFDLGTLSAASGQSPQILLGHLWSAVQYGLISTLLGPGLGFAMGPDGTAASPVLVSDADPEQIRFTFIHDRIQEAAYGLMADNSKMDMHLRIGRLLLEKCSQKHLDENIFDILGQLNRVAVLITEPEEIENLAELNLKAGQRTRSLALFESAFDYFRMGIHLMAEMGWQHQYELTKELHLKGIAAALLSGRYSELDNWYEAAVEHIRSPVEVVDAYIAKMEKERNTGNFFHAIDVGGQILTRLGVSLPTDPPQADVQAELEKTETLLSSFSDDDILGLPDMVDLNHLAALRVIRISLMASYWVNRQLHNTLLFKCIDLMLRHGTSELSAIFFCAYANILTAIPEKIADAHHYGRLSIRLLDKNENSRYNPYVRFLFYAFTFPFSDNVRKSSKALKDSHRECMENGDFVSAGYSLYTCELFRFFSGEPLENVSRRMAQCRTVIKKIRIEPIIFLLAFDQQMVLNLMGRSEHRCALIGKAFDERIHLPQAEKERNQMLLVAIYFNKLILACLFERYQAAVGLAEKIEDAISYFPHLAPYLYRCHFYIALARLATCQTNCEKPDSALLEKVAIHEQRLRAYADAVPMNCLHMLHLVKAERARVEGRIFEAQEHFDRAAELAEEHGYLQDKALANELAAKFWMGRGKKAIARLYMHQALGGYTRWGAAAKVRDLQEKHPEFLIEAEGDAAEAPEPQAADLDMMSAVRASRAISGEIELGRLVEKLMAVVVENAGATSGRLLLESDGRFYVAAEAAADQPGQITRPGKAIAVDQAEHLLPLQLVQYVQRTGKPLVIEDAASNGRFGQDPYILKNRPRSVLCSPIVRKDSPIGMFYLENNLATNAFTEERLKMLEILSAQIAVSLENAKLYTERYKFLRAVETEHAQLLSIFDSMGEVIYIADPKNYDLLYGNEVFRKNWGEPVGQKCYRALQGRDDPCSFCTNDKIFGENLGKTHIWEFQNETNRRWYRCIDRAIKWTDGSMVRFEMAIDNHDLKMAQSELRQAQKMESIGNLAGGIAHDFNNLLTSIIGFTELALDEVPKGISHEDFLQEVLSAGIRAKGLVKQILTFARKSDEKKHPIQPSVIAKDVLKLIRSTIPTSIEIRQDIDCESQIMSNATQIHQVLMNLCTNAAHAMEDSGGVLEVSLKDLVVDENSSLVGITQGDYIQIKVSDTGKGIAPDVIESIFDPYFTTKGPGEGTGMGLAMAHGVVESHGGKITADSQLGKGATFRIYLPATKNEAALEEDVSKQLPAGTERILIVDDEIPIVKLGIEMLERMGYSVVGRTSSLEALELFKEKHDAFDLVITDMTMPDMTGDKLAIEFMRIRPDIPVILCSGYSKKISDKAASKIGIKAFAYKPMVKADLAETVRKVLDDAKDKAQ